MAIIRWTLEAHSWLKDIYDYIANDNRDSAQKVVSEIYKRIQLLKEFPESDYYNKLSITTSKFCNIKDI